MARPSTLDFGLWTLIHPAPITALFALILVAAFLITYRTEPAPPLSATNLLSKAIASEELLANNRNQVLHRTVELEEKSSTGQLIARRRIDVWHSAEKGVTARRLYDESGSVVAEDWRRADGVQTLYHHSAKTKLQPRPEARQGQPLITFDNAWQVDPTAKDFSRLIGDSQNAIAHEESNTYVIVYGDHKATSEGLIKATLVLGRGDLHAVEQTLLIRQADEVREFRFVESVFERRSLGSVAPAVFEPEPALLGADTDARRHGESERPAGRQPISAIPFVATPELELQVVTQLNDANAFFGEQISLTRTAEGRLRVQGIVETDERKVEILRSLASVKGNPAVQIQVETVAEAAQRQARQRSSSGSIEIGSVAVEAKKAIPAEAELRAYLSRQRGISGEELDQEVRRFADRVMARSRQARRHSLALKQIAERFSVHDLRALDDQSRNQWRTMISQHAKAVERELGVLQRELQSLFPLLFSGEAGAGDAPGDAELAQLGKRLFDLATQIDEAVSRSFSIYVDGATVAPVNTNQFSSSFRSALSLSRTLARGQ